MITFNSYTIYSLQGIFETFFNNFFKIGVDLFLMLSGALLLGCDWGIKDFLSKRILRITKPFLFWSVVFSIMLICSSYFIPSINFVSQFGIYGMLKVFWDTLMFKAPGSATYWFFWMMFGVYLVMPLFNNWIKISEMFEIEYFLVIWIIFTIFEYTLLTDCPVELSYFTSPIGFVVLGYYLRYTDRKIFNNSFIALVLILFSSILMLVYSYLVVDTTIMFSFHRYAILPIIEVTGVFLFI